MTGRACEFLAAQRAEILRLTAARGARNVRVFGSAARGQDGAASEIEFLVSLDPGCSLFDLGGLLMDLQQLLGRDVGVVTDHGLRPRVRDRVLREVVPL